MANIKGTRRSDEIVGTKRDDVISLLEGDDTGRGNSGADRIRGGGGNDSLFGDDGNDTLFGDAGNDQLFGGSGNDVIDGGRDGDLLTGGSGADRFVFSAALDTGGGGGSADQITDFNQRQGDLIDVSKIDADPDKPRDQSFHFIGNNAFTGAGGEARYFFIDDGAGGAVTAVLFDIDGDRVTDFKLGLDGAIQLTAEDFRL